MEFYSEERLHNWIRKIEESEIREDDAESLTVFDQMLEDIVIACLNVVRAVKEREITKSDAIKEIEKMSRLFTRNFSFGSEIKDEIFQFTLESVKAVLASFRYFFEGKSSKKSFESLLSEAVKKEKAGDLDAALDAIARMGAKVIKGEKLPEFDVEGDGVVLSWLDGIDLISTVIELSRIDAPAE